MTDYSSELDEILENAPGMGWGGTGNLENCKAELSALLRRVEVEAVKELRRRWDEDRKTMDFVPDTYMFICDKYIQELEAEL